MRSCSRRCNCRCEGNVEEKKNFQMRSCSKRCSCRCEGNVVEIFFFRWDPVLGGVVVVVKVMLRKIFFFQMRSCSRRCSCCEGNVEVIGKVRSECKKNYTFASRLYLFHIHNKNKNSNLCRNIFATFTSFYSRGLFIYLKHETRPKWTRAHHLAGRRPMAYRDLKHTHNGQENQSTAAQRSPPNNKQHHWGHDAEDWSRLR